MNTETLILAGVVYLLAVIAMANATKDRPVKPDSIELFGYPAILTLAIMVIYLIFFAY